MGNIKVYFSDFFEVDEDIIEEYGAINISLINDLGGYGALVYNLMELPKFPLPDSCMIDALKFLGIVKLGNF